MPTNTVTQIEATYLPESNEYLTRVYGASGELIQEHRATAHLDGREDVGVVWTNMLDELRVQRENYEYLRDVVWPRWVQAERRTNIFCDVEWAGGFEYGEQPDIKDERGGALDEFLDGFKPQETTPERSDNQK